MLRRSGGRVGVAGDDGGGGARTAAGRSRSDPVSKVNLARRGDGSARGGGRGLVSFPWLTVRFLGPGFAVEVEVAADVPAG